MCCHVHTQDGAGVQVGTGATRRSSWCEAICVCRHSLLTVDKSSSSFSSSPAPRFPSPRMSHRNPIASQPKPRSLQPTTTRYLGDTISFPSSPTAALPNSWPFDCSEQRFGNKNGMSWCPSEHNRNSMVSFDIFRCLLTL